MKVCVKRLFVSTTLVSVIQLAACGSMHTIKDRLIDDGTTCKESLEQAKLKSDIGGLNLIREMFYRKCYKETIQAVSYARGQYRDSILSLTKDAAELVIFEGVVSDYVMESYERTYLSLLAVRSYIELNQLEEAKVELRKAYQESIATLDTKGQDRITLFIIGTLWDTLGERDYAEPVFRRVIELSKYTEPDSFKFLAEKRLKLKSKDPVPKVFLYEIARLPEFIIDSNGPVQFRYPSHMVSKNPSGTTASYIDYTYNRISSCNEGSTTIEPTTDWLKVLANRVRYPQTNNTKTNVKRLIRYPLTIFYSATVFAAGAYLTVLMAKSDARALVAGPAMTVMATTSTYHNGLAPDMRYWENLPQAFVITDREISVPDLNCLEKFKNESWLSPKRWL